MKMLSDAGYFAAIILSFVLPLLVTITRFVLVRSHVRNWTPNEYGLVFTQLMQFVILVMGMVIVMELSTNFPSHSPDFILKIFWAQTFVYLLNLWSIKLSVNLLYLRLTTNTSMHKYAVASMYFLGITFVACMLYQTFNSFPISCHWQPAGANSCRHSIDIFWLLFACNMATDMVLFVIPFPIIRKIKNRALQVALGFVFALGIFVVVMACVRIVLVSTKPSDNIENIHILSNVQCAVAAVIAVLPGLSSPLMRILQRYGHSHVSNELNRIPDDRQPAGTDVFITSALTSNEPTKPADRKLRKGSKVTFLVDDVELGMESSSSDSCDYSYRHNYSDVTGERSQP